MYTLLGLYKNTRDYAITYITQTMIVANMTARCVMMVYKQY